MVINMIKLRILLLLLILFYTSCLSQYCGNHSDLPANSSGECDPTGDNPCCNHNSGSAMCGNAYNYCTCEDCVDYRVVQDLRDSDTNCAVIRVGDFLKNVCSDVENKEDYYFACMSSKSDTTYRLYDDHKTRNVSKVCDNDNYAYQSCVFRSDIRKNYKTGEALCGGYH